MNVATGQQRSSPCWRRPGAIIIIIMIIILINLIGCWWLAVSSARAGEIGGQRNGNSPGHSNHPTMSGATGPPSSQPSSLFVLLEMVIWWWAGVVI